MKHADVAPSQRARTTAQSSSNTKQHLAILSDLPFIFLHRFPFSLSPPLSNVNLQRLCGMAPLRGQQHHLYTGLIGNLPGSDLLVPFSTEKKISIPRHHNVFSFIFCPPLLWKWNARTIQGIFSIKSPIFRASLCCVFLFPPKNTTL